MMMATRAPSSHTSSVLSLASSSPRRSHAIKTIGTKRTNTQIKSNTTNTNYSNRIRGCVCVSLSKPARKNHDVISSHLISYISSTRSNNTNTVRYRSQRLLVIPKSSSSSSSSSPEVNSVTSSSKSNTLLLGVLFSMWYAANIVFNIYNKQGWDEQ